MVLKRNCTLSSYCVQASTHCVRTWIPRKILGTLVHGMSGWYEVLCLPTRPEKQLLNKFICSIIRKIHMYLCKLLPSAKRCPRETISRQSCSKYYYDSVFSPECSVEPPKQTTLAILSPDWTSLLVFLLKFS